MNSIELWYNARKNADKILFELKDKVLFVNNYFENVETVFKYKCRVIMVNPRQSFDDDNIFDYYVVVKEIDKEDGEQFHFLLDKVKDKLQ